MVNMKKTMTAAGITLVMGGASFIANAALLSNAILQFDPGVTECNAGLGTPPDNCTYGTRVTSGSFFSIDTNGDNVISLSERTAIISKNGIRLGETQLASGSHFGIPDGTETASIDNPFYFFGNTGMHGTTAPITITSDDGSGNVLLDMSSWYATWAGVPLITLGSGSWGTNPEGQANLTCSTDCSIGDTFSLYYTAMVPQDDPSGLGGIRYRMGLDGSTSAPSFLEDELGAAMTGIITSPVPVPAAVWLFGSGLIGLIGIAKRKKA